MAETQRLSFSMLRHLAPVQMLKAHPPCAIAMSSLTPILLSSLKLETHHLRTKIVLRVCSPPHRRGVIMTVVEDENGTVATLELYMQSPESLVSAFDIFNEGDVLVLKEPYLRRSDKETYSLLVDHVSDLIWLNPGNESVPQKWRPHQDTPEQSAVSRLQGNRFLQEGKLLKALERSVKPSKHRFYEAEANICLVILEQWNLLQARKMPNSPI